MGAPSLDHLRRNTLLTREQIEADLALNLNQPTMLIGFHPVTIARDTIREADALFTALSSTTGQILFCYPNADAGSRQLIDRSRAFALQHGYARVFVNLNPISYFSLLRCVDVIVGNSSSGVMEAASFGVPAVDVGMRQRGRERGPNVLNADANPPAILGRIQRAFSPEFRRSLVGMDNIYGDGHASERIAEVIASVPLGEELLIKKTRELC